MSCARYYNSRREKKTYPSKKNLELKKIMIVNNQNYMKKSEESSKEILTERNNILKDNNKSVIMIRYHKNIQHRT